MLSLHLAWLQVSRLDLAHLLACEASDSCNKGIPAMQHGMLHGMPSTSRQRHKKSADRMFWQCHAACMSALRRPCWCGQHAMQVAQLELTPPFFAQACSPCGPCELSNRLSCFFACSGHCQGCCTHLHSAPSSSQCSVCGRPERHCLRVRPRHLHQASGNSSSSNNGNNGSSASPAVSAKQAIEQAIAAALSRSNDSEEQASLAAVSAMLSGSGVSFGQDLQAAVDSAVAQGSGGKCQDCEELILSLSENLAASVLQAAASDPGFAQKVAAAGAEGQLMGLLLTCLEASSAATVVCTSKWRSAAHACLVADAAMRLGQHSPGGSPGADNSDSNMPMDAAGQDCTVADADAAPANSQDQAGLFLRVSSASSKLRNTLAAPSTAWLVVSARALHCAGMSLHAALESSETLMREPQLSSKHEPGSRMADLFMVFNTCQPYSVRQLLCVCSQAVGWLAAQMDSLSAVLPGTELQQLRQQAAGVQDGLSAAVRLCPGEASFHSNPAATSAALVAAHRASLRHAGNPYITTPAGRESVAQALQGFGAAVAALLPTPNACNSPECDCLNCTSEADLVKHSRCGRCKVARVCEAGKNGSHSVCQLSAWKQHKVVCKLLAK